MPGEILQRFSKHENTRAFTNQHVHSLTNLHIHPHWFILSTTGPGGIPGAADDLVHALNESIWIRAAKINGVLAVGVLLLFIRDIENFPSSDFTQTKMIPILLSQGDQTKNSLLDSHPWQRKPEDYKSSFFASYAYRDSFNERKTFLPFEILFLFLCSQERVHWKVSGEAEGLCSLNWQKRSEQYINGYPDGLQAVIRKAIRRPINNWCVCPFLAYFLE